MAALIGAILLMGLLSLPRELGKAKASKTVKELFAKSRPVNLLAAARIFLFGARDVWFVVGLPVFLYVNGWSFVEVGGFLAAWTIAYGIVQAIAPGLVTRSADGLSREVPAARLWSLVLLSIPLALMFGLQFADSLPPRSDRGFGTGAFSGSPSPSTPPFTRILSWPMPGPRKPRKTWASTMPPMPPAV